MEASELEQALRAAIEVVEKLGIDYYLFGANARNIWAQPRYTDDGDLILRMADNRQRLLLDSLRDRGFTVEQPRHYDRLKCSRMVRLLYGRLLVDFVLGETDFEASAMGRRKRTNYLSIALWAASPEDLILHKLIARRPQDIADIENVIRSRRATLDRRYLRRWAKWLADQTGFLHIETTLREMLRLYGRAPRRKSTGPG